MVKPDYSRDYYADLGLPAGAEINDIKKQYRQLALKYHPDRNPGQEEQAKERFVIIQVAHEILSDPGSKSKYDANRRRPTTGTTGSGVRGNPYSNVSRDMSDMFGAPPKRTARQQPTPYSNWGVPQNAPKPKSSGNPFDHLRAWDRMKSSSSKPAPTAAASGSSGPSTSSTKPPTKPAAQPPPPPPRTAYQARQQEASFGTTRRTGFAPASPMGDEPQVKNNNYNSNYSGYNGYTSNLFAETAANLRKAQTQARPASAHADGPTEGYDGAFNDTRQRTPYASNVGEKTNPFEGASATRAKNVRESWRKSQEEEPESSPPRPPRQRSASVGEREGFTKPPTSENAPKSGFPNGFGKPPATRFTSRASERYSPRPPGDAKPPQRPPKVPASGDSQPAPAFQSATASGGAPASKPNVFTVPDDDETPEPQTPKANPPSQQARFMRNSTESINTRFVSDDKPSKYEFNAGGPSPNRDPLRTDPFLRAKQRSRSTPRGRATSTTDGPATPPVSTANPLQPEVPKPSAFDAGQWQQKIGPHNFVPPPVARQASSPTRPTRVVKKPKASKIPAGAVVIDLEDSSDEEGQRPAPTPVYHDHSNMQGAPSPNAMDIDPPSFEAAATPTGGARTINVEPSKPEWRPGHVSGVAPEVTAGSSAPPPKPATVEPEGPPIFEELRNVEPFAAPKPAGVGGAGLGGFGDMKLNLPFPSQAAETTPLEKEMEKQQQPKEDAMALLLKDPPSCPHAPVALSVAHPTVETIQAWADYARGFHKYLREWTAYEKRIVEHFVIRKRVREEAGDGTFAWVHMRGDAAGRRYIRELEQDRAVRREWDDLAEAHEARVREFAAVHKRVEGMLPVPA